MTSKDVSDGHVCEVDFDGWGGEREKVEVWMAER